MNTKISHLYANLGKHVMINFNELFSEVLHIFLYINMNR